ncbi:MAG: hypothetical protein ACREV3_14405 [Gammaproteobacteria bacterium]
MKDPAYLVRNLMPTDLALVDHPLLGGVVHHVVNRLRIATRLLDDV